MEHWSETIDLFDKSITTQGQDTYIRRGHRSVGPQHGRLNSDHVKRLFHQLHGSNNRPPPKHNHGQYKVRI